MKYDIKKHTKTLELDTVLQKLSNETSTEDAASNALKILPENNIDNVNRNLAETEAAYILISKYSSPS